MKYHQHIQKTAKHFSSWMAISQGQRRAHRAGCCDCGLIHDEQYRVVFRKNGKLFKADMRMCWIEKRVRVNRLATASRRKAKHNFVKKKPPTSDC